MWGCSKCSDQACINSWKVACPVVKGGHKHYNLLQENDDVADDEEEDKKKKKDKPKSGANATAPAESAPTLNIWLTARDRPTGAIAMNQKYVPANTHFHYYDDHMMDASAKHISQLLENEHQVHGVYVSGMNNMMKSWLKTMFFKWFSLCFTLQVSSI